MKKTIFSIFFVLIFAMYALYQYFGGGSATTSAVKTIPPSSVVILNKTTTMQTPTQTSSAIYKDGTYTGAVADAYFGNVQVEAVVSNGNLSDVQFLRYPKDNRTSAGKSSHAMPILKSEAISSQNANVNIISGATQTSRAFVQSLGSALTQAKV